MKCVHICLSLKYYFVPQKNGLVFEKIGSKSGVLRAHNLGLNLNSIFYQVFEVCKILCIKRSLALSCFRLGIGMIECQCLHTQMKTGCNL